MKNTRTLIALILVIAAVSFVLNPLRAQKKELEIQLAEIDSKISKSISESKEEKNVVITEIDKQFISSAVPNNLDQEQIIKILNGIALDTTSRINTISFNTVKEDKDIATVQITISGSTSKENFKNFIYALENNARTFIIQNMSMSLGNNESGARTNFTINLETYFS